MDSKGRYYALDKRFPWSRGVVFLISIVAVVVVCVLLISGIDASREANRLRKENRALRQEKTILADSLTVYRMRADFMKSFSSSSVSWDSVDYVHQKL